MSEGTELDRLRSELDSLDRDLVGLVARRLDIVALISDAKAGNDAPIRDQRRERAVLDAVETAAREMGVSADLLRRIFREIIAHSVDRQVAQLRVLPDEVTHVGFQGIEYAYSHLAAQKFMDAMGQEATFHGFATFADVVEAVIADDCRLAVLPIENTTAGSINQVYDLLQSHDVSIVGEETWRVDHCLAGLAYVPLEEIRHILSHPQGLEQCARFLRGMRHAAPEHCFDTSAAMRSVAERADPSYAAIGSAEAAEAFGLVVLRREIADQDENYTRFVVVSRDPVHVDPRVPSKTSMVLTTRHEKGALLRCLQILADAGHSLTKLESRPRPGHPFDYVFFLDFEGNVGETVTQNVIGEIRKAAISLKVLGSYPAKAIHVAAEPGDMAQPSAVDSLEALIIPASPR